MDTFFSQLSSLSLLSITVRLLLTTVFRRGNFFPQRTIGRTQTSCQTASMTLWCASLLNARDRQMTV